MSVEPVAPTDVTAELAAVVPPPQRTGRLALAGFGLGILSFALWASVGLPAPLVGVFAIVLCWLALLERAGGRAATPAAIQTRRIARWGLAVGLIKLAVFLVVLGVAGFAYLSTAV